jgi:hypothetical protein
LTVNSCTFVCIAICSEKALDPAFPLFDGYRKEIRLSKDDAQEIIVFHSNIGPLGFGMRNPVGTIDIYLNDGQDQPGCTPMKDLMRGPFTLDKISGYD